ncbi:DUF1415 domain-containing protein [Alteromonas sp. C1M14]|uniref:DUF1415 domain-containing protein n=1 Tax=Alteromonas sp. C1M14 TaxID=2841567 RepID=UPI001C08FBC1|nr:DUF1415 domain-containing protein [Alteromonas sp. C1M14]MBU2979122.1 DUF1415 domain-containing protein [Alteromonas sp. C1M14]
MNSAIISATRAWLEKVVIGYNFCPFAKPVFVPEKIAYIVQPSADFADMLETLYEQCKQLQCGEHITTTLIIYPNGVEAFDTYLDLLGMAEQFMDRSGFTGEFQLASFHPDYVFAEQDPDSAANYTNRSPYPMLHIIREVDIDMAMKEKEDASAIYQRNIRKANTLGAAHFDALLAELKRDGKA